MRPPICCILIPIFQMLTIFIFDKWWSVLWMDVLEGPGQMGKPGSKTGSPSSASSINSTPSSCFQMGLSLSLSLSLSLNGQVAHLQLHQSIQLYPHLQRGSSTLSSKSTFWGRRGTVGNFGSLVCCLSCGLGNLRTPSKAPSLSTVMHCMLWCSQLYPTESHFN